jgi:hypothetical protein
MEALAKSRHEGVSQMAYRYLAQHDVHVVDCSGPVDLELGMRRLELLQLELGARPAIGGRRKLLVDFRYTVWESPEVHMRLAALTREALQPRVADGAVIRVAFLHHERTGPASENEHWFLAEAEALEWLQGG